MFKLIERRANFNHQEDIYKGLNGQTLSAIYPKDNKGFVDIYQIQFTLRKNGKILEKYTKSRNHILANTNHAETQDFSVDQMYDYLINLNRSQQGYSRKTLTKILYELIEEMRLAH